MVVEASKHGTPTEGMILGMKRLTIPVPALALSGALSLTASPLLAQGAAFQTPGMPVWAASGQVDRFSSEFNPAIGALLDGFADFVDTDEPGEDGIDLSLRSFEMTVNGRVDPNWWGYAVIVYADDEVELEEAAVTYQGFEGHSTVRFGRFFADFGKQMQAHIHDLPYPERPGVLAEYLGDELPGVGAQFDHWWTTSETSALRASFGLFGDMELGEEGSGGIGAAIPERKDASELALTARVTQFMDAGKTGVFQWGASVRHLGGFSLEDEDAAESVEGLSSTTAGFDLTYGFDSDDGLSGWTFGAEALLTVGDLGAESDQVTGNLAAFDGERSGAYVWAEHRADVQNTYGLLVSSFEQLDAESNDQTQLTAYYTRHLSEYARLRFAVSHASIEQAEDSNRFLVQLTTFFGPHAHGVNW